MNEGIALEPRPKFTNELPTYRSPELLRMDSHFLYKKASVWAMGCILYELLFSKPAFRRESEVLEYAASGKSFHLPQISENMFTESTRYSLLSDLIPEMLALEPSKRPNASQIYRRLNAGIDPDFASDGISRLSSSKGMIRRKPSQNHKKLVSN